MRRSMVVYAGLVKMSPARLRLTAIQTTAKSWYGRMSRREMRDDDKGRGDECRAEVTVSKRWCGDQLAAPTPGSVSSSPAIKARGRTCPPHTLTQVHLCIRTCAPTR